MHFGSIGQTTTHHSLFSPTHQEANTFICQIVVHRLGIDACIDTSPLGQALWGGSGTLAVHGQEEEEEEEEEESSSSSENGFNFLQFNLNNAFRLFLKFFDFSSQQRQNFGELVFVQFLAEGQLEPA